MVRKKWNFPKFQEKLDAFSKENDLKDLLGLSSQGLAHNNTYLPHVQWAMTNLVAISEEEVEISGFMIIMDLFDIVVGSRFFSSFFEKHRKYSFSCKVPSIKSFNLKEFCVYSVW